MKLQHSPAITEQNRTYVYFNIILTQLMVIPEGLHGEDKLKKERKKREDN